MTMPYNDPDPDDPSILVGVSAPGDAESTRTMAAVFAEEFARLGYPPHEIFGLFENPQYGGPHAALRALGPLAVLSIIRDAAARWPAVRIVDAAGKED
jgi:hypothetical protein